MVVEWLFLTVPWGCLWFVIVVFPDHTHLLFSKHNCLELSGFACILLFLNHSMHVALSSTKTSFIISRFL